MLKHHRSSLGRLAAGTPKEKAGLVRCLLVSMETARRSGQTMQDVWHTLEVPGLSLRYHVFLATLGRARNSNVPTAPGCREKTVRKLFARTATTNFEPRYYGLLGKEDSDE